MSAQKRWWVYLLRCGDGTLYCGIALDVEARLEQHGSGKGAKYTRGRGPLELVYREACLNQAEALRRERAIKRLRRSAKAALLEVP
jgi:predicted GIY-YIG superfamily endonuclease